VADPSSDTPAVEPGYTEPVRRRPGAARQQRDQQVNGHPRQVSNGASPHVGHWAFEPTTRMAPAGDSSARNGTPPGRDRIRAIRAPDPADSPRDATAPGGRPTPRVNGTPANGVRVNGTPVNGAARGAGHPPVNGLAYGPGPGPGSTVDRTSRPPRPLGPPRTGPAGLPDAVTSPADSRPTELIAVVTDPDAGDAAARGRHRKPPKKVPLWREVLTLVGVALLMTFLIQTFVARVYSIPSGSMERTLHGCAGCDGDRVLVDKFVLDFRDPEPGDVIVFHGPDSWSDNGAQVADSNALIRSLQHVGSLVGIAPPNGDDFVKRVVAVGGQTIRCCDERGRVLVDDKPLDESYIYWEGGTPSGDQEFDAVLVPEGTVWVMGDNRANSCDSRCQGGGGIRGVVPLGKIIGKARTIVLPPSRWQGVGDNDPRGDAEASALGAPSWQQGLPLGAGLLLAGPTLLLWRRLRPWRSGRRRDGE